MIKGNIETAEACYAVSEKFRECFVWIKENNLETMPDGRYEISDDIYANVQSYVTKDDAPYEAHKSYIDVQYMISGSEISGVVPRSNCSVTEEYNEEKDVEFLKNTGAEQYYKIEKGEFFIFFPKDAHKPGIKDGINKPVKKVIVKIKA